MYHDTLLFLWVNLFCLHAYNHENMFMYTYVFYDYFRSVRTANVQILTISKTSVTALPVVDKCLDCNYVMCMLHYIERVTRKTVRNRCWYVLLLLLLGFYFSFFVSPTVLPHLVSCTEVSCSNVGFSLPLFFHVFCSNNQHSAYVNACYI